MDLNDRLSETFDRGPRDGVDALDPSDRELFRIQDFIIEYEMNGISGYFCNRLPDLDGIHAALAAMRNHGLGRLAEPLGEATTIFAKYVDPSSPSTWADVLRQYDPSGKLDRIRVLRNYGIV